MDKRVRRFSQNILNVYPALWTFARVEGVEPTNNHAERTLRLAVIWRKISFGNHSEAGCRAAMRGLVPDTVFDRRDKIGFATPERQWLGTLRPWVEKVLNSPAAAAVPALNLPAVRAQWDAVVTGRCRFDSNVWRWVNLICWAEHFQVSFAR